MTLCFIKVFFASDLSTFAFDASEILHDVMIFSFLSVTRCYDVMYNLTYYLYLCAPTKFYTTNKSDNPMYTTGDTNTSDDSSKKSPMDKIPQQPLIWMTPEERYYMQVKVISEEMSNPILQEWPYKNEKQFDRLKSHLYRVEAAVMRIENLYPRFPVVALEDPYFAFMDGRKRLSEISRIAKLHLRKFRPVLQVFYKYDIEERAREDKIRRAQHRNIE